MMQMKFQMTFNTPAFLGDAERKGAMRSPPFKSLIRHFWRIEKAGPDYAFNRLMGEENCLFGFASQDGAAQSVFRLKLGAWEAKKLEGSLPSTGSVFHPEARGGRKVEAALYLGYGPIGQNSALTCERAIAPGKDGGTTLSIAFPNEEKDAILNTIKLIQAFGTVGGRSRNGWGSLCLSGEGIPDPWSLLKDAAFIKKRARPLNDCLKLEWPHAIGLDDTGRPLIWTTKEPRHRWNDVIKDLADIKVKFRTSLEFGGNRGKLEERHVIAYPVTNHQVAGWSNDARLPNQLRFKVIEKPDGVFVGVAFHIPCKTPEDVGNPILSKEQQIAVWKKVHKNLDQLMERV